MQNQTDEDLSFKIILVGDQGVGKSSIVMRYVQDKFRSDYNVTIGVEFALKYIDIDNDLRIKLQIWDTAGQEAFHAIIRSYYRNISAAFLVYQVDKRQTFLSIVNWLNEVRQYSSPHTVLILMGNQSDREDREVSFEEGEQFMKANNIHFFFETSAKDGIQINQAFDEVSKMIFLNYIKEIEESDALPDYMENTQGGYKRLSTNEDDSIDAPQTNNSCCGQS